jgi:hypothetical protein
MNEIHVSKLSLAVLLNRAIHQRNAASCHEIERRQLAQGGRLKLEDYLLSELTRARGGTRHDDEQGIYELANEMIEEGFLGQGMRDEENASDYIKMAADNPSVEDELPESGFAFWKSAKFHYRKWRMKNK